MDTAPCTTLYTTSAQRAHNVDTTSYTTLRTTFYTTLCAVFHMCLDMTEYIGVGEQHNLWQSMFVGSSSRSQLCEPRPLNAWHCGAWTHGILDIQIPRFRKWWQPTRLEEACAYTTFRTTSHNVLHNVLHNVHTQRPTQRPQVIFFYTGG